MKKIGMLLLLISSIYYSQNFAVQYLAKKDSIKQIFILNIENGISSFFSNEYCDSKVVEPFNYVFIEKKKNDKNEIVIHDLVEDTPVFYNKKLSFNWKILNDTKKINNILLQKAEMEYLGKSWVAWYDPNNPVTDGPFIFCGLPGLIYNISSENYSIELISIENTKYTCQLREEKEIEITEEKQKESVKKMKDQILNAYRKTSDLSGSLSIQSVLIRAFTKDIFRDIL